MMVEAQKQGRKRNEKVTWWLVTSGVEKKAMGLELWFRLIGVHGDLIKIDGEFIPKFLKELMSFGFQKDLSYKREKQKGKKIQGKNDSHGLNLKGKKV